MTTPKPTIVIVPGAWQRIDAFLPFADRLKQAGYNVECVGVPSTGGTELPLTGLPEDIAAVRAALQPLVEQGRDVVLLVHSAGGVSGSGAVRGLDANTRREAGLAGGVTRVIYMTAFMIPKGKSIMGMLGGQPLPWMIVQDDRVIGDAKVLPKLALHDLPPAAREEAMKDMTHTSTVLFSGESEYEPWNGGIPCAYIVTKQDGSLPAALQEAMASQLGPNGLVVNVEANHCPFLSVPEELLAAVEKIVAA